MVPRIAATKDDDRETPSVYCFSQLEWNIVLYRWPVLADGFLCGCGNEAALPRPGSPPQGRLLIPAAGLRGAHGQEHARPPGSARLCSARRVRGMLSDGVDSQR